MIPGELVICVQAPWHDGSIPCSVHKYGPKKDEIVTIDFLMEDNHGVLFLRLVEYPNDPTDKKRFQGFMMDFFKSLPEPLITTEELYQDLKNI